MNRSARILPLLAIAFVACVAALPASAAAASSLGCADTSTGTSDLAWTADILAGTNAHRTSMGLTALTLDPSLTTAATWKARDMARRNYFAHDDQAPAGSGEAARSPWDRLIDCGYNQPMSARAENIAAGQQSGGAFVTAWLNSPGHRANIENPAMRYVGLATAQSGSSTYGTYSVQIFSSMPGNVSPAVVVAAPTTTKLTIDTGSTGYNLCPEAGSGVTYHEDSATGPITVIATAAGCLRIAPAAARTAGTGTISYRAWNAQGVQSPAVTLTVVVATSRELLDLNGDGVPDSTTGGGDSTTGGDAELPRTVLKDASATIVKARCRGRWSVAGWCYTLVTRATLLRPNGNRIADETIRVTRRTLASRSALLGTATTTTMGTVTLATRLKPPVAHTATWLLRNVRSVQLQYLGSTTQSPSSAVATTRMR